MRNFLVEVSVKDSDNKSIYEAYCIITSDRKLESYLKSIKNVYDPHYLTKKEKEHCDTTKRTLYFMTLKGIITPDHYDKIVLPEKKYNSIKIKISRTKYTKVFQNL